MDDSDLESRLSALLDREGMRLVWDVLWDDYRRIQAAKLRDLDEERRGFGIRVDTPLHVFLDEIDAEAQDEAVKRISIIPDFPLARLQRSDRERARGP